MLDIKNICIIKISLKLLLRKVYIRSILALKMNAAHDGISL